MHWTRDIELLTPTFCRGAYQDTPEIRVPSIRGMTRWWFRALGGTPDEEKGVFGGMKRFGEALRGKVSASQLVFRVSDLHVSRAKPDPFTLPHKQGGQASPQAAFAPGGQFRLEVFSRFDELPATLNAKAVSALDVWTLLGAFGLRSNRAGGSVWPLGADAPQTPYELRERLAALGCNWPICLAGDEAGSTMEDLRAAATDTVSEPREIFGSARGQRLASPLKIKVVRLDGRLRLLIAARTEDIVRQARKALEGHRSKPVSWQSI